MSFGVVLAPAFFLFCDETFLPKLPNLRNWDRPFHPDVAFLARLFVGVAGNSSIIIGTVVRLFQKW
jgi:hypothetical protein